MDEERPLIGRDDELRKLAASLEDATAAHGRLIVLAGEPGIGKTRLADELAAIAEKKGFAVAWGRCWESAGVPPAYLPWTQIFRALGRRVPELEGRGGGEDARFRVVDAVFGEVQRAALERPLLLVIDDAHAADPPSLHALLYCAKMLRSLPAVVVVTARDVAADPTPEASALLHKIGREGDRIALRRLTIAEVEGWIAAKEPARAPAFADAVHRITEGNPLFVDEVLRMSTVRGSAVPEEVRTVIAAHLDLLAPATRELLSVASVLGREIDGALVAAASGASIGSAHAASIDDTEAAMVAAMRVGVVVERATSRWAFSHVLLRDELYRTLAPSRRAAIHASLGEAFAAGSDPDRLAMAAHHLLEGASASDVRRVLDVVRRAAEQACRVAGFEQAAALLLRAQALAPDETTRVDLSIELASAKIRGGDPQTGTQMALDAAARARTLGVASLMARAALVYGTELFGGRVDPVMVRLLREALAALGPDRTALRARVLSRLASALVPSTPDVHAEAREMVREAMSIADEIDDDAVTYFVVQWAVPALGFTMPSRERGALVQRLLGLAQKMADPLGELRALQLGLVVAIEEGRPDPALEAVLTKVRQVDRPYYAWRGPLARALVAFSKGDIAGTDEALATMRAAADPSTFQWTEGMYGLMRMSEVYALADPTAYPEDEAVLTLRMASAPYLPWFAGFACCIRGRLDEARTWLEKAPAFIGSPPLMVPAGEMIWRLGDRERAVQVLAAITEGEPGNPFVWGPMGAMCFGPVSITAARVAAFLGRKAEAIAWYELALRRCDQAGFPLHRAQACAELAELDDARSANLRAEALRLGEQFGMTGFVARLRAHGSKRPSAPSSAGTSKTVSLVREGDTWRLEGLGAVVRLKDGKGVRYLERLLGEPGRELHALDLVGLDEEQGDAPLELRSGDAGPMLDAAAKAAYRARLEDLRDALEEATKMGDRQRASKAQSEIDAIADELARAVGLGGRDRKAGSAAEKARINVQRRVKDVLERVTEHAPKLGRWLGASIRTGTFCSFTPV